MQWVSNRVVSDIRNQLFSKMLHNSMDFFNKARSGIFDVAYHEQYPRHADGFEHRRQRYFQAADHHRRSNQCAAGDGLEVYPGSR